MHLAARTCLNCVPRVSSVKLPISARPYSSTSGTPLSRLLVQNTDTEFHHGRCLGYFPLGFGSSGWWFVT
jgi:hypothetical protein